MSISLTVLYNQPEDKAVFDKHYDEVHIPLAAKLPQLQSFSVVRPGPGPDGSAPQYHLIATLAFPSAEALQESMGGPEGQAANADLGNFAQAGATLLIGEAQQVL